MARRDEELEEETPPERGFVESLSLGLVAMAPLFLAYELAVARAPGGPRNTSELLAFRMLAPLGARADMARQILLGALVLLGLVRCLRRDLAIVPRVFRVVAEGVGFALLIGPLLILCFHLLRIEPPESIGASPKGRVPELLLAGRVLGGSAYEEIVFRVGLYSVLHLAVRRIGMFLGLGRPLAVMGSEVLAALGSAVCFAAFHLTPFVTWLGRGGEPFDLAVFTYRTLAGLFLALIFRWRGPGIAAWTHGWFNLALLLGAGPDVFLQRG